MRRRGVPAAAGAPDRGPPTHCRRSRYRARRGAAFRRPPAKRCRRASCRPAKRDARKCRATDDAIRRIPVPANAGRVQTPTIVRLRGDPQAASRGDDVVPTSHYPPVKTSLPIILSSRSEEHTSELQSLMRISYAVFCLKKKTQYTQNTLTQL